MQLEGGVALQGYSVGVVGVLPLLGPAVEGSEGSAELSTYLVGVAADLRLNEDALHGVVGAQLLLAFAHMRGRPNAGFEADDTLLLAPALAVRAGLRVPLMEPVKLWLFAQLGSTLQRLVTRFGQRDIAHWGQPFFVAGAGLCFSSLQAAPPLGAHAQREPP